MKKSGMIAWDTLMYMILAAFILVLGFIIVSVLTGKGSSAIDFIKNFLRFP